MIKTPSGLTACARVTIFALACFALFGAQPSEAKVVEVDIVDRQPVLGGRSFGDAGAYEKIVGRIRFSLDPDLQANRRIVDLSLAPRDEFGGVSAVSDFMVLRPLDARKGRGVGLLEVSNRGGKATLPYFASGRRGATNPVIDEDYGDALPLRLGLTMIWVGWQFDVPQSDENLNIRLPILTNGGKPIVGLVRSDWVVDQNTDALALGHRGHQSYPVFDTDDARNVLTWRTGREAPRNTVPRTQWRFGRTDDNGRSDDDPRWISVDGGFRAGRIYEFVYAATDPQPVGIGLAAVRDTMSYALYDDEAVFAVDHGLAFGVSQTGRFLRHFLYQGFNVDEEDRPVFGGMLIHTAGAGRGSFNHRFAQPSRDAHRYSAFFYPTDLFPFSSLSERDPVTDRRAGLLDFLAEKARPRIMVTNTGYEYWGRAASLTHVGPVGEKDLELAPDERSYHLSSGQHFVERWPPDPARARTTPDGFIGNPLDFLVNLRALLARLVDWVADDREPPPSRIPRLDRKQLVSPGDYVSPNVPGLLVPDRAHVAYRVDFGPEWPLRVTRQPPVFGLPFVSVVPTVDGIGNEVSGVRNVETRVPLATYTPWALRQGLASPDELIDFRGMFVPLPLTAASARESGDTRPSVQSLYASREDYLKQVSAAMDALVSEGFLLVEDRQRVMNRATELWTFVHRQSTDTVNSAKSH
jgi:hypothetical protein